MAQQGCFADVRRVLETSDISLSKNGTFLSWAESVCAIVDHMIDTDDDMTFVESKISDGNLLITLEYVYVLSLDAGYSHPFFDVIRKFDKFIFETHDPDHLQIKLVKSFMWSK